MNFENFWNTSMHEALAQAIREQRVILFVGAGVSTSVGAPDWRGLMDRMADDLGYDPALFVGNFLTLAQFHRLQHGGDIRPLLDWMRESWAVSEDALRESRVHRLIAELNIPRIYTTNYDPFIERSLALWGHDVSKVTTVRDLVNFGREQTQVVKFHGDFDNPDSIILTESDYFRRLSFESALDIKLRSDSLGRAILFIGYSLTDINIRMLLYKLTQVWEGSGEHHHRPESYLFSSRPDPIQDAVLKEWGVTLVTEDVDDPDAALCAFLERLLMHVTKAA